MATTDLTDPRQWYNSKSARDLMSKGRRNRTTVLKHNRVSMQNQASTLSPVNNSFGHGNVKYCEPIKSQHAHNGSKRGFPPTVRALSPVDVKQTIPDNGTSKEHIHSGSAADCMRAELYQTLEANSSIESVQESREMEKLPSNESGDGESLPILQQLLPKLRFIKNKVPLPHLKTEKTYDKDASQKRTILSDWLKRISHGSNTLTKLHGEQPRHVIDIDASASNFKAYNQLRLPTKQVDDQGLQRFRDTYTLRQKSLLHLKALDPRVKRRLPAKIKSVKSKPAIRTQQKAESRPSTAASIDLGPLPTDVKTPEPDLNAPKSTSLMNNEELDFNGHSSDPKEPTQAKVVELVFIGPTHGDQRPSHMKVVTRPSLSNKAESSDAVERKEDLDDCIAKQPRSPSVLNLSLARQHSAMSSMMSAPTKGDDPYPLTNVVNEQKPKDQEPQEDTVPEGYIPVLKKFNTMQPFAERCDAQRDTGDRFVLEKKPSSRCRKYNPKSAAQSGFKFDLRHSNGLVYNGSVSTTTSMMHRMSVRTLPAMARKSSSISVRSVMPSEPPAYTSYTNTPAQDMASSAVMGRSSILLEKESAVQDRGSTLQDSVSIIPETLSMMEMKLSNEEESVTGRESPRYAVVPTDPEADKSHPTKWTSSLERVDSECAALLNCNFDKATCTAETSNVDMDTACNLASRDGTL